MTPEELEFERALRALRPRQVGFDPAAAGPAALRTRARRRRRRAGVAAAVLAVGAWWCWGTFRPEPLIVGSPNMMAGETAVEPATLLVYRRALMTSPAELDAALDRQRALGRSHDLQLMTAGAVMFRHDSDEDFSYLGDM